MLQVQRLKDFIMESKRYNAICTYMLVICVSVALGNEQTSKCTSYLDDQSRQVVECKQINENDLNNIEQKEKVSALIVKDCSDWSVINFEGFLKFSELLTLSIYNCTTASHLKKQKRSMQQLTFKAVQNVSIQYTQIYQLQDSTFSFFPNVEYIILDHNQIETVEKKSFEGLLKLKCVNLSHNLIENIEEGTIFAELFDLSNNSIQQSTEETHSFIYLENVQFMYLLILSIFLFYIIFQINTIVSKPLVVSTISTTVSKRLVLYLHAPNTERIGQITIYLDKEIGKNVFKGKLKDKRVVAVKRMRKITCCNISEIDILLNLKGTHHNVIQYILTEENEKYKYLALMPLCDKTLMRAITSKQKDKTVAQYLRAGRDSCLEQLAKGLEFIHNQNVQHRDIKPRNILVLCEGQSVRFIITDFDLGHITGKHSNPKIRYGTEGWIAPELRKRKKRRSSKVDIFSMGCVFYYALTQGEHPFGRIENMRECQESIQNEKKQPTIKDDKLNRQFTDDRKEQAKDLIVTMIKFDPDKRPPASKVLRHPFFWSIKAMISFFVLTIGFCLDDKDAVKYAKQREYLKADSKRVFGDNWKDAIPDEAVKNDKYLKKNAGKDMCSLLKVVRNKISHVNQTQAEAKNPNLTPKEKVLAQKLAEIYKDEASVVEYFHNIFPRLLLHAYLAKRRFEKEENRPFDKDYEPQ